MAKQRRILGERVLNQAKVKYFKKTVQCPTVNGWVIGKVTAVYLQGKQPYLRVLCLKGTYNIRADRALVQKEKA